MIQLILHGIGDYLLQSHWMATKKTTQWFPAIMHAGVYTLVFALGLWLICLVDILYWFNTKVVYTDDPQMSWQAMLVIFSTHLLIDRFRLVRYLIFAKNFIGPRVFHPKWSECQTTGFSDSTPIWLSMWLMIICDNILHLSINFVALRWL